MISLGFWSERVVSNHRPHAPKARALPTELHSEYLRQLTPVRWACSLFREYPYRGCIKRIWWEKVDQRVVFIQLISSSNLRNIKIWKRLSESNRLSPAYEADVIYTCHSTAEVLRFGLALNFSTNPNLKRLMEGVPQTPGFLLLWAEKAEQSARLREKGWGFFLDLR